MAWLWIALSFLVGYLSAEWPRLLWCKEENAVWLKELSDPEAQRVANLHPVWVFVVAIPWIFFGMSLGRRLSPPSAWEEYWFLWCVFLVMTASGIGTGLFEFASGMTPGQLWINSSNNQSRVWCDPKGSRRNGLLRIRTCVAMTVLGVMWIHWL